MGVMSYSILLYAFKGSSAARYYGLAGLMKVGSIINLALLEFGWSPALNNLEVVLQMGILFEILLLSYAMAKRYNLFKFQTFQHVLEAREKERSLIGKTIHDEISNPLTGLTYSLLNKANTLDSDPEHRAVINLVREQVKTVQEHARAISHTMVPDYIQRNSLTELVERYINGIRGDMMGTGDKQPISFHFSTNEQPVRLDIFQKSSLYRVIVELINNVVKHSDATSVDIILVTKRKELTLIVDDNGKGFDPQARRSGIGLDTVRSTIELLNGRMNLESYERGQSQKLTGSRITIKIPYNQKHSRNSKAYDF
jgi:signal transduction histidine kinase